MPTVCGVSGGGYIHEEALNICPQSICMMPCGVRHITEGQEKEWVLLLMCSLTRFTTTVAACEAFDRGSYKWEHFLHVCSSTCCCRVKRRIHACHTSTYCALEFAPSILWHFEKPHLYVGVYVRAHVFNVLHTQTPTDYGVPKSRTRGWRADAWPYLYKL